MVVNVDKMKARGWISSREASTGGQLLTVTARGQELVREALPSWKKAQQQTERLLSTKGTAAIRSLHRSTRP